MFDKLGTWNWELIAPVPLSNQAFRRKPKNCIVMLNKALSILQGTILCAFILMFVV